MKDPSLIFVTGTGHCGSTLLDLVLSSHPAAFGVGELIKLKWHYTSYFKGPTVDHLGLSQFWDDDLMEILRPRFRSSPFVDRFPFVRGLKARQIYLSIARKANCEWIIDSSKNAGWSSWADSFVWKKRCKAFLVLIERRPEAVIASYKRKYHKSVDELIPEHYSVRCHFREFYNRWRGSKALIVYEEFARCPEAVVCELCSKLGMPFVPDMLEFSQCEHHHVGGNAGTMAIASRGEHQSSMLSSDNPNSVYYNRHPSKIQIDERWRDELTDVEVLAIQQAFPDSHPLRSDDG